MGLMVEEDEVEMLDVRASSMMSRLLDRIGGRGLRVRTQLGS